MSPSPLEAALRNALAPSCWLTSPGWSIRLVIAPAQVRRWEIFRGQLVSPDLTRVEQRVASWEIHLSGPEGDGAGPAFAVHWLVDADELCVTRGFAIHGVKTQAEGNVITTQPAIRWTEELLARRLLGPASADELTQWLQRSLLLAVVGTSRLAITSTESPHPAWSWGQCHYLLSTWRSPDGWWRLESDPWLERGRLASCDFELRRTEPLQMPSLATQIVDGALRGGHEPALAATLHGLFGQLSLTPAHHLLDNLLTLLRLWRERTPEASRWTRLMADMVRQLGRHLTAFDLRRFHNQGANYPDALLMDGFVKLLLPHASDPATAITLLSASRIRRELEGLPVPDEPTSPGDLLRFRPGAMTGHLEKQIVDLATRQRRLFVDEPLAPLLPAWLLEQWRQQRLDVKELGLALFLDRPLGVPKVQQRVAIDRTPLVSYLAFSRSLASQRLAALTAWGWLDARQVADFQAELERLVIPGIPADDLPLPQPRPGVVCLEDARRAAGDFIITAITERGKRELLANTVAETADEEEMLAWLRGRECRLLVRSPRSRLLSDPRAFLTAYDHTLRPHYEFALPSSMMDVKYAESPGREDLVAGLLVVGAWNEQGQPRNLPAPAPRWRWRVDA